MSQNEIDRLLAESRAQSGAPSPDANADQAAAQSHVVRPYDFRHPNKLSKDQMRTLQMVFENCARLAATGFSRDLRTRVQMTLTAVEQSTFQEYLRVLNEKKSKVLSVATAEPLPGSFVFEYSQELAFVMIDHLLGGTGEGGRRERPLTEIEGRLLRAVAATLLDAFREAWGDLLAFTPALQRIEYSARYLQLTSLSAPVVLIGFDARLTDTSHEISLCLPYAMIERDASRLNMQALFMATPSTEEGSILPPQSLAPVRIPLSVELGRADVPFSTLRGLAAGDFIRLDGSTSDPVLVRVNGQAAFWARPGLLSRGQLGAQVLRAISTEEERQ